MRSWTVHIGYAMDLIPEEELSPRSGFNFAPMVDFLFIVIAIFAVMAITRKALYDTHVNLVQHGSESLGGHCPKDHYKQAINLSIASDGTYKWLEASSAPLIFDSIETVKKEMEKHASDKAKTHVLLHIDQDAHWKPIAKLIFAMHEEGFTVYPVYEKKQNHTFIMTNEDD